MDPKSFKELQSDETLRRRLAKSAAFKMFRSSEKLENLHEGIYPSSETGDYSDVKIISPFGEIPWNRFSRFSDEEIKEVMREVVDRTYTYLTLLFGSDGDAIIEKLKQEDEIPNWDEPKLLDNLEDFYDARSISF
jgi:hypothetical protein